MKILFFQSPTTNWENEVEILKKEFPGVKFIPQKDIKEDDIREAKAFVGLTSSDNIEKAANLDIIFLNFTGSDRIPFDLMGERGVRISNTHGNARFVAERALAMTMAFYGKIIPFHYDLKKGKWHGVWGGKGESDSWDSLFEKNCAIIGTGEIGKWIARYLKLFNCNITGFKKKSFSGKLENFDRLTTDLKEALADNEIIFVTLPLTNDTRGMFTPEILSKMNNKFIINVGRGEVIDEEGLYDSLKNGTLKGAALDVWYSYPDWDNYKAKNPSRFPFSELENVLLSPHVGGSVPDALKVNLSQTVDNIRAYLKSEDPDFEVNISEQY